MTRRAFIVASAAGLTAPAAAQTPSFTSDTTVSMPLSWSEVNGNNNGILEPGESAAIVLDVSFTNQFGVAHFSPPVGTFSSGTILGFGSGFIDLDGQGGTAGVFNIGLPPGGPLNNGTTGYGVRAAWRLIGGASHGSVNSAGTGVTQILFGQFSGGQKYNTQNPVARMYALLWTPASYAARAVTFAVSGLTPPTVASVVLDLDGSVGYAVFVDPSLLQLGSVSIPIAPAPPAFAALGIAALTARHRRRAP
jgi:hypothetical protein